MNFFLISLGCPKNLTDSEDFCARLLAHGHNLVFDVNKADAVLINTCGFLASSVKEAEENIKYALKLKNAGKIKKVFVTGCMVERLGKSVLKKFPKIDLAFSIKAQDNIENILGKNGVLLPSISKTLHAPEFKMGLTLPHTAYLKIADGCNNRCSYCTIPFIRGIYRSKPLEEVLEEAKIMAKSGVKEISLIAQDTTSYGQDLYGKPQLEKLLKKLVKIKGLERFRIMYAYPHRVTKELAKIMAGEEKIYPYLDLPLQHISAPILKAMNRHSGPSQIKEVLAMLRETVKDIAIRTNFIVGFPGETEEQFEELKNFVRDFKFENVAVFEYFRERGASSYNFKKQISASTKRRRALELEAVQSRVVDGINKKLIGKNIEVIADAPLLGRTYKDAPDIDGTVTFDKPVTPGKIFKAKIISAV
ncbi:MAG: 30S ribosomal protein S12 methylthiotransferase RimO, partial [Elusimicrobiaceae bacterium]|nr:30S ribosomal protein S12 methylthiotransferase RimO [Elusimicrobiaceae bacterium]